MNKKGLNIILLEPNWRVSTRIEHFYANLIHSAFNMNSAHKLYFSHMRIEVYNLHFLMSLYTTPNSSPPSLASSWPLSYSFFSPD